RRPQLIFRFLDVDVSQSFWCFRSCNMLVINELSYCPRRESNPHLRFRKPDIVRGETAKIIAVCVLCVLFASPCHKGPHGKSMKSNIVVVQDTQSRTGISLLTDMDVGGISARRPGPNWNGIRRKFCSPKKVSWLRVWTNSTAGTLCKR